MIHINGKKLFILGFESSVDEKGIATCTLTSIRPRMKPDTVHGSDFMIVNRVCNELIYKYMAQGFPSSKATPLNPKTFNRDFGIKLSKKKMFRKVFRDIDKVIIEYVGKHRAMIDQYTRLNAYMTGVESRNDYSIHKMNLVAAKLEGDVDINKISFDEKTGKTVYYPQIITTEEGGD